MITFVKAFKTSDGQEFENLEDAQRHELDLLFEWLRDILNCGPQKKKPSASQKKKWLAGHTGN